MMNEMHFHCQACKKAQWLPEDQTFCSYCGSNRLWEIVEEEADDEFVVPEKITVMPVSTQALEDQAARMLTRIAEET